VCYILKAQAQFSKFIICAVLFVAMEAAQNDAMQQVERLVAVNEKLLEVETKLQTLKPVQLHRIEQLLVERAQLRANLQKYAAGAKHIEVAAEVGSYVNRTAFAIPAASSVAGSPGSGLQPMLAEVKALSEENALLRARLQEEEQKAEQAPQEGASALGKHRLPPAAVLPPASRLRADTAGSSTSGCSVGGGSQSAASSASGSNSRIAQTAAAAAASDHDATDTDDELQQQQQQQQQPVAAAAAAACKSKDKGTGKGKRKAVRKAAKRSKADINKEREMRTYPLPIRHVPVHSFPADFNEQ
jgi:hypothetical protein